MAPSSGKSYNAENLYSWTLEHRGEPRNFFTKKKPENGFRLPVESLESNRSIEK
jgi:hypothetical protein